MRILWWTLSSRSWMLEPLGPSSSPLAGWTLVRPRMGESCLAPEEWALDSPSPACREGGTTQSNSPSCLMFILRGLSPLGRDLRMTYKAEMDGRFAKS